MTLEHIPDTAEFVRRVRRSIGDRLETTVFFQVPSARYVLGDLAFWDVYYEHCSYFDANALTYLFEACGFQVLDTHTEYDDQYLVIEAKPFQGKSSEPKFSPTAVQDLLQAVEQFRAQCAQWNRLLDELAAAGQRVVIWGGGSKGVAFLTALQQSEIIRYAVDINPNKHGTYMAGTGHEIVGPATMATYQPDVVIVMNPIYCEEIRQELAGLGVQARILAIDEDFSQGSLLQMLDTQTVVSV